MKARTRKKLATLFLSAAAIGGMALGEKFNQAMATYVEPALDIDPQLGGVVILGSALTSVWYVKRLMEHTGFLRGLDS